MIYSSDISSHHQVNKSKLLSPLFFWIYIYNTENRFVNNKWLWNENWSWKNLPLPGNVVRVRLRFRILSGWVPDVDATASASLLWSFSLRLWYVRFTAARCALCLLASEPMEKKFDSNEHFKHKRARIYNGWWNKKSLCVKSISISYDSHTIQIQTKYKHWARLFLFFLRFEFLLNIINYWHEIIFITHNVDFGSRLPSLPCVIAIAVAYWYHVVRQQWMKAILGYPF